MGLQPAANPAERANAQFAGRAPSLQVHLRCRADRTRACRRANGICWADDAQVAAMSGQKEYGERPRLDVTVTVLK